MTDSLWSVPEIEVWVNPSLMDRQTSAAWRNQVISQYKTSIPKEFCGSIGPIEVAGRAFTLAVLAQKKRLWVTGLPPRERDSLLAELDFWQTPSILVSPPQQIHLRGEIDDPEAEIQRLSQIESIRENEEIRIVLTDPEALTGPAPSLQPEASEQLNLKIGAELDPEPFEKRLESLGYERVSMIHGRHQYARRGGILDLYPPQGKNPLRLEFFDTEIDSIREFDLHTQSSVRKHEQFRVILKRARPDQTSLSDWISENDLRVSFDPDEKVDLSLTSRPENDSELLALSTPFDGFEAGDFVIQEARQKRVQAQIQEWKANDWSLYFIAGSKGEKERFLELTPQSAEENWSLGILPRGLVLPQKRIAIISLTELLGRSHSSALTQRQKKLDQHRAVRSHTRIDEWEDGDFVVHAEYGISLFLGLRTGDEGEDEILLEFRGGATLQVPIDQAHLVARYVGMGGPTPKLNQLGDGKWSKTRKAAEGAILDYAARLLRIQAERESHEGNPCPPDTKWMWEFENAFPYHETPDQQQAILDVKAHLESPTPMDRLICGDVGFGKTEIAIRAAFKTATSDRQVAILAPTTVLAEQHWRTFKERMSDFPVRIELLSRFQKATEAKKIITGLANGTVDIVIGTHRLLSPQIIYKNIGLVVIDEEQRFGVKHKEAFKERFRNIDVLSLSATPIPRTLYLSLMGAREMSTIDTPPPNRIPVQTSVCAYDDRLIRDVIERELKRGGQVFFLHNRVKTIEMMRDKIESLVPSARVVIGHGQMDKIELESVMHTFVKGKADVLLATTIIESGIDIPNANTIIIDRADRFGLADLYQLRGRVGRSGRQAYAILLLPRDMVTSGDAQKRVNAIKQYTALGSGFKIAMRDLEIRGAGNLLGTKQSGHIAAVGFELYCQLLRQSIDRLQGKTNQPTQDVVLRADFIAFSETDFLRRKDKDLLPAFIPSSYISEPNERVAAYRELALISDQGSLNRLQDHWRDRYGGSPKEIENIVQVRRLRLAASLIGSEMVEIQNRRLMIKRHGSYIMLEGNRFPRLSSDQSNTKLCEAVQWLESY